MNEQVRNKLIEHIRSIESLSEEQIREYEKSITLSAQIFYCRNCEINVFNNPRISIFTGKKHYTHPKCWKCNKKMNRVIIPKLSSVKKELRLSRPRIYCFINVRNPISEGDVITVAIAEDGIGLVSHYSGSKYYGKKDIGFLSKFHHETYLEKYPDGFELIWVKEKEFETHQELQKVLQKLDVINKL